MRRETRRHRIGRRWGWLLVVLLAWPVGAHETTRVSVGDGGTEGNAESRNLGFTKNGRFVGFHSEATNLVPGDTNGVQDIFVHDRKKGRTARVSVSSAGDEANALCAGGNLSDDGRFAVFHSPATNLVPGDTNDVADVFLRDRKKGVTTRVSVSSTGAQADGASNWATISPDGRYIAFPSAATNLVPGDTNGVSDIFLHDRKKGATTRISVSSTGEQADAGGGWVSLSKRAKYVFFQSSATNLVPGDTNGAADVFVRDRKRGRTTRLSVSATGEEGDGESLGTVCSDDGRYVTFVSVATNLVPGDTNANQDAFVVDRKKGRITRVSVDSQGAEGIGASYGPTLSPDGRYVAFSYSSPDLAPGGAIGHHEVHLHDRKTGTTTRVSVDDAGVEADSSCWRARLSKNARQVVFYTDATNLVAGDENGTFDVFLVDRRR